MSKRADRPSNRSRPRSERWKTATPEEQAGWFKPGSDPRRGPGPAPSELRTLARRGSVCVIPRVMEIALDPQTDSATVIRALDVLLKYGIGREVEVTTVTHVRPTYNELVRDLTERLPRVIPLLPLERRELARLFQERQRIASLIAERMPPVASEGNGS